MWCTTASWKAETHPEIHPEMLIWEREHLGKARVGERNNFPSQWRRNPFSFRCEYCIYKMFLEVHRENCGLTEPLSCLHNLSLLCTIISAWFFSYCSTNTGKFHFFCVKVALWRNSSAEVLKGCVFTVLYLKYLHKVIMETSCKSWGSRRGNRTLLTWDLSCSSRALAVATSFTPQTIPSARSHSSGNSGMCSQRKLLCSPTALVPYHSSQWTDSPKLVVSLTHLIIDKKDTVPLHKPFYLFFKAINKPLITMFPYLRLFRSMWAW